MDEMWERAVETALEGERDPSSVRNLTLDGTVKCIHGRLPPPSIFEKFPNLQQLSIANIGVSSLEQFPRLKKLEKLILSDNRIAGGLEFLVEAGLESLRDLDLSNNKIQDIIDLRPLAELRIVSLDLYECPITRVKDYRSRVFGLIKSLKYLDKMDAEENERPESDDEDDDDEEEVEEEDDPGSGEIDGDGDGEERAFRISNGHTGGSEGVVEVDEDEESDADEEETETGRGGVNVVSRNGDSAVNHHSNGFIVEPRGEDDVEDDGEDEEDDDFMEEVDEEDDVVEVHDIEDSDDEEDGVDDEDDDDDDEDEDEDDDDDDEDDEEVDNDKGEFLEPGSSGRLVSTEGEIDAHEQGEDDADEDDDGETGEEELGIEEGVDFDDEDDAEDEDEDNDSGFLVQPVDQGGRASSSVMEDGIEDDIVSLDAVEDEDDDDEDGEVQEVPEPPSAQKRKRDEEDSSDEDTAGESESSKRRR